MYDEWPKKFFEIYKYMVWNKKHYEIINKKSIWTKKLITIFRKITSHTYKTIANVEVMFGNNKQYLKQIKLNKII